MDHLPPPALREAADPSTPAVAATWPRPQRPSPRTAC